MRPEPKRRIDTNAASQRGGLNAAFAGLDLPGLPPGAPPAPEPAPPLPVWKMGRVVLRREMAHRGGKTVIVIHDFATHLPLSVIETTAKKLRQACGCGGRCATARSKSKAIRSRGFGSFWRAKDSRSPE